MRNEKGAKNNIISSDSAYFWSEVETPRFVRRRCEKLRHFIFNVFKLQYFHILFEKIKTE